MSVLTVGSGKQFSSLHAAIAASHDGDTIYIQAGTYLNDFSVVNTKINIVGVGGLAHFDATVSASNGKGFLVTNTDVNIDHLEFSGAKVSDLNAAGVRFQGGGTLTITNSYFHDNQNGILGGGTHPEGNVVIDHSEFAHNGAGDGYSHNIYVAESHSLTVTNSYMHDAVVGHELKSRAEITTVLNNRIADYNGTASYDIDLGKGGLATIRGNYIQQGPNSQNPSIINYGGNKFAPWGNSQLIVEDNVIVNQLSLHPIGIHNRTTYTAQIQNNHFYGLDPSRIAVGLNAQSGNDTLAQLPTPDTSHPWAASPWDTMIWMGAAANVLNGTAGHDLFVGSSGSDTFVIRAGGNSDTIAAFDAAGGDDVVRLDGYGFSSFAGVKAAMLQNGADVVLNLGHGETLTFQDKTIASFTAADFTFSSTEPTSFVTTTTQSAVTHPTLFKLPASGAGVNSITGDRGNNLLVGTGQNDLLDGRAGADTMQGGAGNDTYKVENAKDLVVENSGGGIDTVRSAIASYTLAANVENLVLTSSNQVGIGNALNNLISSGSGNNTLSGLGGNDILNAGTGADVLTGGAGNDIFVFSQVGAKSTITDFHVGEDLIDMRKIMSAAHYAGTDPLADHAIDVVSDGHGGSLISVDPTHSGTSHPLVDVQGAAPTALYIGLDILWH